MTLGRCLTVVTIASLLAGVAGCDDGTLCDANERVFDGDIEIVDAGDFETMRECEEIGGSLTILFATLETIPELRLTRIGGHLQVVGNGSLSRLAGLHRLQSVGGDSLAIGIWISEKPQLQSLDGLRSVTEVGARVVIEGEQLSTIELESLRSVRSQFLVWQNQATRGISMPALESVGNAVFRLNPELTDLSLPSFVDSGRSLDIRQNPMLPTCQAEAIADQLLDNGWDGTVQIGDNLDDACQ